MRIRPILAAVLVLTGSAAALVVSGAPAQSRPLPPVAADEQVPAGAPHETAVLAGGCFWGVQGVFEHVAGVLEAEAGYAGGEAGTADYESVSGGATGHAESVRITYDPSQITFGEVLRIFFAVATDPTALNRQGPDVGPQYRSAVFAQNPDQQRVAEAYIDQLNRAKAFPDPIVTTVSPQSNFYPAEWYHQNYLELHPDHPYISFYDKPKIDELRRLFPDRYRDQAVLVKRPG